MARPVTEWWYIQTPVKQDKGCFRVMRSADPELSCCVDTVCWASRINGVLGSLLLNASLQMINRCHSRLREILHHVCVLVACMHVLTYACVSISMYAETLAALTVVRTECVHTCLLTTTIQLFTLIFICWDSMQQLRHGLPSPKEMY